MITKKHITCENAPFLAVVVAATLFYVRAYDAFAHPQFWAEDGTVFWLGQYRYGWSAFFLPTAGYLNIVPRLVAVVADQFDVALAPLIYVWATLVIVAWAAWNVAGSVPCPALGLLLGASLTFAPNPGGEIFGNLANVQWFLGPTLAAVLCGDLTVSHLRRVNHCILVIAAGLSGPFSVMLMPVTAWRFAQTRDRIFVLAFAVGAVQATILYFTFKFKLMPDGETDTPHLIGMILMRCVSMSSIGAIAAAVVLFASVLVPHGRNFRIGLLYIAAAVLTGTVAKFLHYPHAFDVAINGSRYFYIPQLALIWCALSLCFSKTYHRSIGLTALAALLWSYPANYFWRQLWPDQHWTEYTKEIGAKDLIIPINPPGWKLIVPAGRH